MASKRAKKVKRTTRKKEQRAWIPGIEKFGRIVQVDADGQTHIECDDGYRWFGPGDAVVTDADITAAREAEAVKVVEPITPEVAVNNG